MEMKESVYPSYSPAAIPRLCCPLLAARRRSCALLRVIPLLRSQLAWSPACSQPSLLRILVSVQQQMCQHRAGTRGEAPWTQWCVVCGVRSTHSVLSLNEWAHLKIYTGEQAERGDDWCEPEVVTHRLPPAAPSRLRGAEYTHAGFLSPPGRLGTGFLPGDWLLLWVQCDFLDGV